MRLLTSDMPLPPTSLWLIVVGLVALSGSAMVLSVGVLLLVLAALVVPMFAITVYSALRSTVEPLPTLRDEVRLDSNGRIRSLSDGTGVDVLGWENEGGAHA